MQFHMRESRCIRVWECNRCYRIWLSKGCRMKTKKLPWHKPYIKPLAKACHHAAFVSSSSRLTGLLDELVDGPEARRMDGVTEFLNLAVCVSVYGGERTQAVCLELVGWFVQR